MIRKLINAMMFQITWFAAVLGAANGIPWLGPLVLLPVLAVNIRLADFRCAEAGLFLAAGLLGFAFDTALVTAGVFTPVQYLLPYPLSPPWMVGLWMSFAATLNVSMSWLQGRYLTAALFGAAGGPLAYLSGARLGAAATEPDPYGLMLLAVGWGVMTPLLLRLSVYLRHAGPAAAAVPPHD